MTTNKQKMEMMLDEIRNNLYQIFEKKVDKEIIELVFQTCGYKENVTFEHLQAMAAQVSDDEENSEPDPDPDPPPDQCIMGGETVPNSAIDENILNDVPDDKTRYTNNTFPPNPPDTAPLLVKRPENLLEQLSNATVPPADIDVVMSSAPVLHQNPAIVQSGPSSPARPRSLFGEIPSTNDHGKRSVSAARPSDSLFHSNPYLAPAFHGTPSTQYSLFMQPLCEVIKDENSRIKSMCSYINYPARHIILLMRGLPGSGKSYKSRLLCGIRGVVYSTDDYFVSKRDNRYQFDPRLLSDAHIWNQERARKALETGISPLFIDNTNMQKWEMKPYIILALKKNYEIKIIEPTTQWAWSPGKLARLNSHQVPKSKIELMMDRYEKFETIDEVLNSKKFLTQKENETSRSENTAAASAPTRENAFMKNVARFAPDIQISPIRGKPTEDIGISTDKMVVEIDVKEPRKALKGTSTPLIKTFSDNTPHSSTSLQSKKLFCGDEEIVYTIQEVGNEGDVSRTSPRDVIEVNSSSFSGNDDALPEKRKEGNNQNEEIDFTLLSINKSDGNDDGRKKGTDVVNQDQDDTIMIGCNLGNDREGTAISVISPELPENKGLLDNYVSQSIIVSGGNTSTSKGIETKDPQNDVNDKDTSPGKIAELLQPQILSSQGGARKKDTSSIGVPKSDDLNLIDLTEENDTFDLKQRVDKMDQFYLNIQFIFECFPDFKKSYCEDWFKRYNNDLVKTCDYLSRLSQVEELPDDPADIPEVKEILPENKVSGEDFFKNHTNQWQNETSSKVSGDILCSKDGENVHVGEDDIAQGTERRGEFIDVGYNIHVATQTESTINIDDSQREMTKSKKNDITGEVFFCDREGVNKNNLEESNDEKISIAMDTRLAKELFKIFGSGESDDCLGSEDLILSLDRDMGKQIFDTWMGSIKARKRKMQTMLEDDERYAQQLQNEEIVNNSPIASPDGKKKKNKDKKLNSRIDTQFSMDQGRRLYGGSFEPNAAWKNSEELSSENGKERLSCRQFELQKALHGMFPGVDEDALNDILSAASFNIESAAIMIRASCGLKKNQAIQNVYATDVGNEWCTITSPPRKKPHTDTAGPSNARVVSPPVVNINGGELYQTMTVANQSYQDFRAEAELHKNLRTENFQKAADAFQKKQGLLAQHYADRAREHTRKMNEAHGRAAELTLERKNREYMNDQSVIDFHGLHVDEALRALSNFLANARRLKHKSVYVITGRGVHSKGSFSTVRNAVTKALTAHNYQYKFHRGGGMVEVILK